MAARIFTAVVQPPLGGLVDLATAKDELQVAVSDTSSDAFLARAINEATATIQNYCNISFLVGGYADTIYPDPKSAAALQLSNAPIIEVSSVTTTDWSGTVNNLTMGPDYLIEAQDGQLIGLDDYACPTPWPPFLTVVNYTAGFAAIPADIMAAALKLVTLRFRQRGRDPFLKSQDQPGAGMSTYWVGSLPTDGGLPMGVADILDNYRVPVVA